MNADMSTRNSKRFISTFSIFIGELKYPSLICEKMLSQKKLIIYYPGQQNKVQVHEIISLERV